MFVKSLELRNYRNYEQLHIEFDPCINILYGDNAQGKTNILESVYVCATTKSHRGSRDKDIVRFGDEEAHIKVIAEKKGVDNRIDMHLKKNKTKGIAICGVPIRKASELFGNINVVFFSPEDLNIIKNGPAERRNFMDLELCQLDKLYTADLVNYNKVLLQRNKLLKDLTFQPGYADMLPVWDEQLISYGLRVMRRRKTFIEELGEIIIPIHEKLTGGKEKITVSYEPDCEEETFASKLSESLEKDKKLKTTSAGPHRDDLLFTINGVDIRKFGSQGQQRSAALSLKLSEIELIRRKIKDTPILLLDDVLSELDSHRQNHLLESIKDIQTLITCTGLDDFVNRHFESGRIFRVTDGSVESERKITGGNS